MTTFYDLQGDDTKFKIQAIAQNCMWSWKDPE